MSETRPRASAPERPPSRQRARKTFSTVVRRARKLRDGALTAWNRRIDRRVSAVVACMVLVVGLGDLGTNLHVRLGFYALVAQVLPILMLAIVVEGRYFRGLEHRKPVDRFMAKGFLFVPMIGEAAALICVAQGHDSTWLRGAVFLAVIVAVALLAFYAYEGPVTGVSRATSAVEAAARQVKTAYEENDPHD